MPRVRIKKGYGAHVYIDADGHKQTATDKSEPFEVSDDVAAKLADKFEVVGPGVELKRAVAGAPGGEDKGADKTGTSGTGSASGAPGGSQGSGPKDKGKS